MTIPRDYDVVLGGNNTPVNAAVLGGIQGVKARLNPTNPLEVKIAALKDASVEIASAAFNLTEKKNPFLSLTHTAQIGREKRILCYLMQAGVFSMGSQKESQNAYMQSKPLHNVTFKKPFYMALPITKKQWKAIVKRPKVSINLPHLKGDGHNDYSLITQVSWDEAVEFCARLSQYTGLNYRLPSEAEWEYARQLKSHIKYGTTGFLPDEFKEWCADIAYCNYIGAPSDGSPFIDWPEQPPINFKHETAYWSLVEELKRNDRVFSLSRVHRIIRGTDLGTSGRSSWPQIERRNDIGFRVVLDIG